MIGLRPLIEELADHLFKIQRRILLKELGIRRKGTLSNIQDNGWREYRRTFSKQEVLLVLAIE